MSARHTGIITPLWALTHKGDFGVGDLGALKKLIPWAAEAGIDFIQLPPVYEPDQNEEDYTPISALALDPLYLDLTQIPELSSKDIAKHTPDTAPSLKWARFHKDQALREGFKKFQQKNSPDPKFAAFQADSADWISTYSLFRFLMTLEEENPKWSEWRAEYNTAEKAFAWLESRLARHADSIYPEILYYEWLQWHCYLQWNKLRDCAERHDIKLMSELPYQVPHYSADAFFQGENFSSEEYDTSSAYNHTHLSATGYLWWRTRLKHHTEIFSISLITDTLEDLPVLRLLKDYSDTEFIWDAQERVSGEFAKELNATQHLLPFYCLREGKDTSPLPTENYPYTSYSTLTSTPLFSTEALWKEKRGILGDASDPRRYEAIRTIMLIAEISRLPLPYIIKHSLDVPQYEKKVQWGILEYLLRTNSRYTAISLADLLYCAEFLPAPKDERFYMVDLFSAHKGLRALQKELRLKIKMLRSAPARVY